VVDGVAEYSPWWRWIVGVSCVQEDMSGCVVTL
jgi:hypothetical protein